MFGKILNFKFTSVSEAKLAASFCSEKFGSKITEYKIVGLNIFIGQTGDLNVSIKFSAINFNSDLFIIYFFEFYIFNIYYSFTVIFKIYCYFIANY